VDAYLAESLLTLAEHAGPALRGLDSKAAFEQLDERYGDLQLALLWFIDQGRADEALRMASALVVFWMATKRLDEGAAWFDRVLTLTGRDAAHRGRALFDAGYLAFWKGNDEQSASLQNQALEIGRRTKDPTVSALALVGLADCAANQRRRSAEALSRGRRSHRGHGGPNRALERDARPRGRGADGWKPSRSPRPDEPAHCHRERNGQFRDHQL
jgi:hypothetical protein